jgi:hypothetical protein
MAADKVWSAHAPPPEVVADPDGSVSPECSGSDLAHIQSILYENRAVFCAPTKPIVRDAQGYTISPSGVGLPWLSSERPSRKVSTSLDRLSEEDWMILVRNIAEEVTFGGMVLDDRIRAAAPIFVAPGSTPLSRRRVVVSLVSENVFLQPASASNIRPALVLGRGFRYAMKIDLKNAYRLVAVVFGDTLYIAVMLDGIPVRLISLPLGLSHAPNIFNRVLAPYLRAARRRGAHVFVYVDDLLVLGYTCADCIRSFEILLSVLREGGWWLSARKTFALPSSSIPFLGFVLVLDEDFLTISPSKMAKYKSLTEACVDSSLDSVQRLRYFESLLGLLSFLQAAAPLVSLLRAPLNQALREWLWDAPPATEYLQAMLDAMEVVLSDAITTPRCPFPKPDQPVVTIVSDASESTWAAAWMVDDDPPMSACGPLPCHTIGSSSTEREVTASTCALVASGPVSQNAYIHFLSDAAAGVAVSSKGSSASPRVRIAVTELLSTLKMKRATATHSWCRRSVGYAPVVDALGKASVVPSHAPLSLVGEWTVPPATWVTLLAMVGIDSKDVQLDLFAHRDRHLCARWCSRFLPEGSEGISPLEALARAHTEGWRGSAEAAHLSNKCVWVYPPWGEVHVFLRLWRTAVDALAIVLLPESEEPYEWLTEWASVSEVDLLASARVPSYSVVNPVLPGAPKGSFPLAIHVLGKGPRRLEYLAGRRPTLCDNDAASHPQPGPGFRVMSASEKASMASAPAPYVPFSLPVTPTRSPIKVHIGIGEGRVTVAQWLAALRGSAAVDPTPPNASHIFRKAVAEAIARGSIAASDPTLKRVTRLLTPLVDQMGVGRLEFTDDLVASLMVVFVQRRLEGSLAGIDTTPGPAHVAAEISRLRVASVRLGFSFPLGGGQFAKALLKSEGIGDKRLHTAHLPLHAEHLLKFRAQLDVFVWIVSVITYVFVLRGGVATRITREMLTPLPCGGFQLTWRYRTKRRRGRKGREEVVAWHATAARHPLLTEALKLAPSSGLLGRGVSVAQVTSAWKRLVPSTEAHPLVGLHSFRAGADVELGEYKVPSDIIDTLGWWARERRRTSEYYGAISAEDLMAATAMLGSARFKHLSQNLFTSVPKVTPKFVRSEGATQGLFPPVEPEALQCMVEPLSSDSEEISSDSDTDEDVDDAPPVDGWALQAQYIREQHLKLLGLRFTSTRGS